MQLYALTPFQNGNANENQSILPGVLVKPDQTGPFWVLGSCVVCARRGAMPVVVVPCASNLLQVKNVHVLTPPMQASMSAQIKAARHNREPDTTIRFVNWRMTFLSKSPQLRA